MRKSYHKNKHTEKGISFNVSNYPKNSNFYFDVTRIYPCIINLNNITELNPDLEEIKILDEAIIQMTKRIKEKNTNYKVINILPEFKNHFQNITKYDSSNTIYAQRIKEIIIEERKKTNKSISLMKITNIYNTKYNPKRSITTISRIMRKHLNLHFKRITIKNPKLNKTNYLFMNYLFLKAVIRALKLNLDIIYVDETACSLENNNYKDWVDKNEVIMKGAEKNVKEKVNIIMGINMNGIIYYKIVDTTINENIFGNFIGDLLNKMTKQEKENSLIIFDNASCHKTKKIRQICQENKLKVLTNVPYKSEYNSIEYLFGYFKNKYYKYCFKNKTELKEKIKDIFESNELKENIIGFYLQGFEKYQNFYLTKKDDLEITKMFEEVKKNNEDELSKSFEE